MKTIGIVGAGTMGLGIAQVCILANLDVHVVDIDVAAVGAFVEKVSAQLGRRIQKDTLTEEGRENALRHLSAGSDYAAFHSADIVIEAATENFDVKCNILGKVSEVVSPATIIASNTSSLSITKLTRAVTYPERFIGMHFFNPVPVMALVEIIRGLPTSDETYKKVEALSRVIGKTPIEVKNGPGFVVNRILCPMINEAFGVLQDGLAKADDIDEAMKLGCNQPIGPLALADMIGLDTLLAIMEVLHAEFGDQKYRPAMLLKEMVAAGRLGRKTGLGVYNYK